VRYEKRNSYYTLIIGTLLSSRALAVHGLDPKFLM